MKKLFILLPLVLALLVSGCATIRDPREVVEESLAKLNELNSYEIEYDYSVKVSGAGAEISGMEDLDLDFRLTMYKKQSKKRVDVYTSVLGTNYASQIFMLPDGIYVCSDTKSGLKCTKEAYTLTASDPTTMPLMISDRLDHQLLDSNATTLKYLGLKTIAGRSCHDIEFDVDIVEFIGSMSGAYGASFSTPQDMPEGTFKITICFDNETGKELKTGMIIEMDSSNMASSISPGQSTTARMEMLMTATRYEPNKALDDSLFELPAGDKATGFAGFEICTGCFHVNSTGVHISLKNNVGSEIEITRIEANVDGETTTSVSPTLPVRLEADGEQLFTLSGVTMPPTNYIYSIPVDIAYTYTNTGLEVISTGIINGMAY